MRLQKEIENFVKNNQVSKTVDVDVTCRHYRSPFSTITCYSNSTWNNYNSLTGTESVVDNVITTTTDSITTDSITTDSNSSFKTNDTDNTATINKTEG